MILSQNGFNLLQEFEGFKEKPYLCSAGIATIGIGTTVYPNGKKVTMRDDPIRLSQAYEYLQDHLAKNIYPFIKDLKLNQNQFDALVSFIYNLGITNFNLSTLKKKIIVNPNDKTIIDEFKKWNKANSVIVNGLSIRRNKESILYFS